MKSRVNPPSGCSTTRARPWSMRRTWSLIMAISPRSWLATRMVILPRIVSMRRRSRMRCPGSSPDSGSSRISSLVGRISATARARRRFMPLESASADTSVA